MDRCPVSSRLLASHRAQTLPLPPWQGVPDLSTIAGCLFLGIGAAQIGFALGTKADSTQALVRIRNAASPGLMPAILLPGCDAFLLQIPFRRMLAVCSSIATSFGISAEILYTQSWSEVWLCRSTPQQTHYSGFPHDVPSWGSPSVKEREP